MRLERAAENHQADRKKYGVDFETASFVFADPIFLLIEDPMGDILQEKLLGARAEDIFNAGGRPIPVAWQLGHFLTTSLALYISTSSF